MPIRCLYAASASSLGCSSVNRWRGNSPLIYPHELRDERLELEDDLTACADAVLVEGAPLDNLGLETVVDSGHELEGESLRRNVSAYHPGLEAS